MLHLSTRDPDFERKFARLVEDRRESESDALLAAQKAKTVPEKLKSFAKIHGKDVIPPVPGFAREPTTGQLMGEAAEKMAKENGITRQEQDAIAHQGPAILRLTGLYRDKAARDRQADRRPPQGAEE